MSLVQGAVYVLGPWSWRDGGKSRVILYPLTLWCCGVVCFGSFIALPGIAIAMKGRDDNR